MPKTTSIVPTVDLRGATPSDELGSALAELGFVQIIGHALSDDARRQFRAAGDLFFAADANDKLQFVHPDPAANRGYRAKGSEALSYSLGEPSPPDLFESFNCGDDSLASQSILQQITPWPASVSPGFEEAAAVMLQEMRRLSNRLDKLIDTALGSPGLLTGRSNAGPDMLATINYTPNPDGTERTVEGQQRMGAHSDYTTFTILDADPVPGLQIVGPDNKWTDVIPEPGALLVNVGDVLAMLTNDHWPSTLHRVVPMVAGSAAHRRSVAYFHYPNLDVEITPLPKFVSADQSARYASVTVEEHVLGKLTAPKVHKPASGASTTAGRPT